MIYLDNHATTKTDKRVVDAMVEAMDEDGFGNPSSTHSVGVRASRLLDRARQTVAASIPLRARKVVFTSGATEANAMALCGAAPRGKLRHIVATSIEHPSVLETLKALEEKGCEVSLVPPGPDGVVSTEAFCGAITSNTALAVMMLVNNEIGTVQPVAEVGRWIGAHKKGLCFHVDAVQAPGQVDLTKTGCCTSMSISGHKIHGPKGIGALLYTLPAKVKPLWHGGGQEGGLRPGTENIPGAAGLARALELTMDGWAERAQESRAKREAFVAQVLSSTQGARLLGHEQRRSPANAAFAIEGVTGDALVGALDGAGIVASTGSACRGGRPGRSHVAKALGVRKTEGVVRFGLSRWTTSEELETAASALSKAAKELRSC